MALAHAVLCASNLDEAEMAFAVLANEHWGAAKGLAFVLVRGIPESSPLWAEILMRAKETPEHQHQQATKRPKAFRWGAKDATDTADKLSARMGWGRKL